MGKRRTQQWLYDNTYLFSRSNDMYAQITFCCLAPMTVSTGSPLGRGGGGENYLIWSDRGGPPVWVGFSPKNP